MSAEKTTQAVGYLRVATGSARKRERSIFLQRKAILEYAQLNRVKIVRFFADHDCIVDITLCQGLSDALSFIECGKAQALAVASLHMLSPSVGELLRFAEQRKILQGGPALIAVRERLDTRTADGRLMLRAVFVVAECEFSTQGQVT